MKIFSVGGAVRDKFLGIPPKDHDWVIVGATSADVESLLAQGYAQVGADFPVFLHPQTGDEYALARTERKSGVGYHGFIVEADASVSIEQDLARRDLTINSMAMGTDGVLVDPYHGLMDIKNCVLRHTSPAFAEDPLRVLRLARFAARLPKFSIAPETIALCKTICVSGELNHLSVERIWAEIERGFQEISPLRFMSVLNETTALEHCELLQKLFGPALSESQVAECRALSAIDHSARLAVGVAVIAVKFRAPADLPGISNRVLDCYRNVHNLTFVKYDVRSMMDLLRTAGALREGPAFKDLVKACTVMEMAGDSRLCFQPRQLLRAQGLIRDVRATAFPGLAGRELGAAIDARQIENLQTGMSIPVINPRAKISSV